jgi:nicotinate-nucleotide adenylyltransferase
MVGLATANNPFFSVTDIELLRPGKSYSIDTILYFLGKQKDPLFFILGRDAFVEIETWKDFQKLFSLCNFIVMTRPGFQKNPSLPELPLTLISAFRYDQETKAWIHTSGRTLHFKEITYLDISSTRVRELIERRESARYLIPLEVEAYIQQHGLYQKNR